MGIVNINDDSFCGDGTLDVSAALGMAMEQLEAGADVIDVGAESARTNRAPISGQEEVRRLLPFVKAFARLVEDLDGAPFDAEQLWPPLLSINTWRPEVVRQILPLGGDLLNDIGALPDGENARLCADHGAALLIMHSVGEPKVAHTHVEHEDILATLEEFFETKLEAAAQAGLDREQIVIDPGIDFAKQRDDNLRIYAGLSQLNRLGRPILLPVSRKTVIGDVLDLPDPLDRDAGTVACIAAGLIRGAAMFRVHNVRAAAQAIKMLWAIEALPDG
jgi:dihydropteroate synthase